MSIFLSRQAAQVLMLAAQGLLHPPSRAAVKYDLLEMIRRMGALQIDTIHVVARSPYLVLWSRLGDYPRHWLDDLLAEGALFEYWSHEASFLPIEDYPLYRHRMIDPGSMGWKYSRDWIAAHQAEVAQLLEHVRAHGPVRSADFVRPRGQPSGWWDWKQEKIALEMLFTAGEVMIARRHNFQRVYDLRERVLPTWDDTQLPTLDEANRMLVRKAVCALGITTEPWIADYFRMRKPASIPHLAALADAGEILRVRVTGWDTPAYIPAEQRDLAEAATDGVIQPTLTTLLSPFDPLVWDRTRARDLFDFDYKLECYTPAPKRRYGYFTLPILRRGALIGRLDAKAHRKAGTFEVRMLHLEPGIPCTDDLIADVAGVLHRCAAWHNTPTVVVRQSDPPELAAQIQAWLPVG